MFKITIYPRAEKVFAKLPKNLQRQFYQKFNELEVDLFSKDLKKIKDTDDGYRLRIGRWRVLLSINFETKIIQVLDIFLKKGGQDYRRRLR